jgi:diketogulonate reductase-like aldo/keto reductase
MLTRKFGSSGVQVPVIGQGTWKMGREGEDALRVGLELGMTHIDTAEMYGDGEAERVIADVIKGRRERVFIVSKVLPTNASYKGTLKSCDASLKRLGTDYLDVYLLHWWSSTHPIADTMRAMEDLVQAGKIRGIGVSNLDVNELKQAQAGLTREKIVCNQVLYHLNSRGIEYSLVPYCESQNIAVVGYSPFGKGNFPEKQLSPLAARLGKTPRQIALRFLTRRPSLFAIPKAGDPDHVRENAGGAGWELSKDDLNEIDRLFPPPKQPEELDTA